MPVLRGQTGRRIRVPRVLCERFQKYVRYVIKVPTIGVCASIFTRDEDFAGSVSGLSILNNLPLHVHNRIVLTFVFMFACI